MHVLAAAHDFYPDPGSGGTGRYVYETGRRLVDRGHRVSVVTRRRGDVPVSATVDGIDVYRYEFAVADETGPAILSQLPSASHAVRDCLSSLQSPPDVVSFQAPVTSLLIDRYLPQSVPRITTFHSPWPSEYRIKARSDHGTATPRRGLNVGIRWLAERVTISRSDGVVALSDFMRTKLRTVYRTRRDVDVVPGGVDFERFRPDAGRYDPLDVEATTFLTVRRLADRMGHDALLDAFSAVAEDHPRAELFIAGDGPLRGALENRAEGLGVADRTTFLGFVPDDDLPAAYATADAFVLPTQELEGFGLATLEALASGCPIVATPVGGTVEVLAGLRDALPVDPLVASTSARSLANGMGSWSDLDDDALHAAGEASRDFVRDRYTWDRTVKGLLDVYDRHRL